MLELYAKNLLKDETERHRHWNKINLMAKVFENVRPLTGNRKILYDIGYTQDITNEKGDVGGISFPETEKPNEPKVRELAIDLCIAKYELQLIEDRTHPKLTDLKNIDEISTSYFVENDSAGQNDFTPDIQVVLTCSPQRERLPAGNTQMYIGTVKKPHPVPREKRILSYERSNSPEAIDTHKEEGKNFFKNN